MANPDPIRQLEQQIRVLTIEYERFFNGAVPTPPDAMRDEVRARLRTLRGMSKPTLVFTFRLNGLEARFNSLNELCNRRHRNSTKRVAAIANPRARTEQGIVVGERPDDRSAEKIYAELYAKDHKKPSFDAFQVFLSKQVRRIQEQTGCDKVRLRVSNDDGRARLRAKPVAG